MKKAGILILSISAICLIAYYKVFKANYCIETIDGYCCTMKGLYFIPYKYTDILNPSMDYIKLVGDCYGAEIGFVDSTHLILYGATSFSEVKLQHYSYIIDTTGQFRGSTSQTLIQFPPLGGYRHPEICIHRDIDTCYLWK